VGPEVRVANFCTRDTVRPPGVLVVNAEPADRQVRHESRTFANRILAGQDQTGGKQARGFGLSIEGGLRPVQAHLRPAGRRFGPGAFGPGGLGRGRTCAEKANTKKAKQHERKENCQTRKKAIVHGSWFSFDEEKQAIKIIGLLK
jgi:hypothetical protein